jgi:hypothetical protein
MSPDVWGNLVVTLLGFTVGAAWLILLARGKRHLARIAGMTAYVLLFPIKIWFWQLS